MFDNNHRAGRFTSSEIYNLMKDGRKKGEPGAPFFTYIDKKRRERKLGRSFDTGGGSRATAWGQLMEHWVVFDKLGMNYAHHGKQTTIHPDFDFWAGTTDLIEAGVKVGDIKCYELDNGTKFAEMLMQQSVEVFKSAYPKEYWQLVSNECIHKVDRAESILFIPLKSELERIREWMDSGDAPEEANLYKYRFIWEADDNELPHIPDDCEAYQSLTTFEFEVPQTDKDALTERVKMAERELRKG